MLTSKIANQLKSAGFSIKRSQEAFVAACNAAMVEIGGKSWKRRKDVPSLVMKLEEAIRVPLCIDGDGPQFEDATFRFYFNNTRKCMLYDIPFRQAGKVTLANIPKVRAKIAQDRRRVDRETKFKDAIREVRKESRKAKEQEHGFVRIPRPPAKPDGQWAEAVINAIAEALAYPQAKALFPKHPQLKKLAEVVNSKPKR